ncbi:MAG: hypothetical protein RRA92_05965 [Gemmatimonadota bacterium]|nr:hypothetical protein [Gemmatimonadota bacterium]
MKKFSATRVLIWTSLAGAGLGAGACGGDGETGPLAPGPAEPRVAFAPTALDLGGGRSGSLTVRNVGAVAVGPVELVAGEFRGPGDAALPGGALAVSPSEISTLNPGDARVVSLGLTLPEGAPEGPWAVALEARSGGRTLAALDIAFSITAPDLPTVASVAIEPPPTGLRQGDVLTLRAVARDADGAELPGAPLQWSVIPGTAGLVTAEGRFVAYETGQIRVAARAGEAADTVALDVTERNGPAGTLAVVGRGEVTTRFTSDHWEHGDAAYTGTWGCRPVPDGECGNTLFTWDISDPTRPRLTDSLRVDARVVNDVKVSADGNLAILTHESSADLQNGITIVDLSDPLQPRAIGRFAPPDLAPGVHNVWIEGDYAYLVVDGVSPASGLRVIDIADPVDPRIVASFYGGESFLHDVFVRDGLAFLSHWTAGLIVLDVGAGLAGGSPSAPVEVGRIRIPGFRVHNAWYWPASGYVFLGDEVNLPGRVRVIDARDPRNLAEVATITVPGAAPHNFWVDEEREIGYFAWYERGLQAFDISGELLGALERQGRQVSDGRYLPSGGCLAEGVMCTWAPQLHRGDIFVSDMNSGLWVLRPDF